MLQQHLLLLVTLLSGGIELIYGGTPAALTELGQLILLNFFNWSWFMGS